jgi:hypothetical protein
VKKILDELKPRSAGLYQGVVSIRGKDNILNYKTVEEIYEGYLKKLGLFYGGVFLFPAKYGPDYYLSSVNVMPKGAKFGSNAGYVQRLNNWKENSQVNKINPLDGYFREVYPYNSITESHIKKSFEGGTMKEFMEGYGSLIQLENDTPQFLWTSRRDENTNNNFSIGIPVIR